MSLSISVRSVLTATRRFWASSCSYCASLMSACAFEASLNFFAEAAFFFSSSSFMTFRSLWPTSWVSSSISASTLTSLSASYSLAARRTSLLYLRALISSFEEKDFSLQASFSVSVLSICSELRLSSYSNSCSSLISSWKLATRPLKVSS